MDYRRSETQAIRVCAGILLLVITMILTRLQVDDNTGAMGATPLRKPKNLSRWSHTQSCDSAMTSNIHFFNTYPAPALTSYQNILEPTKPGDAVRPQLELVTLEENGSAKFMTVFSQNDTTAGLLEHTFRERNADLKIVHLNSPTACLGADICALRIQIDRNNPECIQQRFLASFKPPSSNTTAACLQADILDVRSGHKLRENVKLPIAESVRPTTLVADKDDLYFVSGHGANWQLHRIRLPDGSGVDDMRVPLPVVDEVEIQKISYISTLNNRLGNGGGIRVTDIPIFKDTDLSGVDQEAAAALLPLLVYPSKNYVAVIRAGANLGVIVHVLKKTDLSPHKSVQFDNMDSAWLIQAPDSAAADFLVLMGSAPPYVWQTEAIDLATGMVETRHSFI